jgi:uncharacterized protein
VDLNAPHLPRPAEIDAYGRGGFRFAGLSHRGSILCLPSGVWPWPVSAPVEINEAALQPVLVAAPAVTHLLLGTGLAPWDMSAALRQRLREGGVNCEVMTTGAAVRTYNILFAEGRRVAAGLIAVD